MSLRSLARAYPNNKQSIVNDNGRGETPVWLSAPTLTDGGTLLDAARVLIHPAYPQIAGQGIYEYPTNPDITKNFIYAPAVKADVSLQRTVGSTLAIRKQQVPEDITITEIWLGGEQQLSMLAEMARVFHDYWVTPLPIGEYLGWEPLDITTARYLVSIVGVQIGGPDYEYREVKEFMGSSLGAYLNTQVTLAMKLEKAITLPRGVISLEGV